MAAPITLPAPAPTRATTSVVVHADLLVVATTAGESVKVSALDAAGTELGTLATTPATLVAAADATLVAAVLAIAVERAAALWPATA